MKKGKRLLVLLIVLAVFCAGAVGLNLYTRGQEEKQAAEEPAEATVLLTTAAEDVTALSYTLGDEEIQLTKQDGEWVYAPRESFPLDSGKVSAMLSALSEISAVRTVAENADSLSDYGLETPQVSIAVTLADGAATAVDIGDKNGTTGDYYVRVSGKDGVYTVGADLYNAFDSHLMGLITSEPFPTVDASAVTALEWSDGTESKTLEYHPDGDASLPTASYTWLRRNADGTLSALDADAVSAYLDSATGLSYASCVSDVKEDEAAYGLDHPSLTLTLYYSEEVPQSQTESAAAPSPTPQAAVSPSEAPTEESAEAPVATPTATPEPTVSIERSLTLWLGGTDESGSVYFTHSRTNRVFSLSAATAQTLRGLTDESLRSAAVAPLQRAELEGLELTAGGQRKTVGVVRTETTDADGGTDTSTAYTLDGGELSAASFSGLFNDLFGLSAEAFTDQPVAADAQAAFTAVIHTNRPGFETLTLELFPYDGSFCQARFENDASRLVNKRDVEALLETFAALAQADLTPEPTATPEPAAE